MSVESRIVTLKFDNAQFEQGVKTSLDSLAKLKDNLNLGTVASGASKALGGLSGIFSKLGMGGNPFTRMIDSAQRGLASLSGVLSRFGIRNPFATASEGALGLQKAANNTTQTMGSLEGGVTGISKSWVAMSTVAITALSSVTSSLLQQAGATAQSLLGINALKDGWSDYGLKIGATQTIMAGTGLGIGEVSKHLKDLDIYADKTIYSLSDMTSNIGKFTNAGVKLPLAVASLKGVAQVAALSGANSGEAARAMYNLGQAIGQGHVKLMDWRSVELANMGTKEFKEELIATAVEMGTLKKQSDGTLKTLKGTEVNSKNFTSTLQDQWLTADALTSTLKRYSDENTEIGKKATKAAQEVKTLGMLMETLAAAMGTGWTDTFEILVGNLPEATALWTGVADSVGGAMSRISDSRNELLQGWKDLGGRKVLIDGFRFAFQALSQVLKPIGLAFRDIFPKKTSQDLFEMTLRFTEFMQRMKPSGDTVMALRRIFAGLFAVFSIVGKVISGVASQFARMFGAMSDGSGGFLEFLAAIGDAVVVFNQFLEESGLIEGFFRILGSIIAVPLTMLRNFAGFLGGLFSGFDENSADNAGAALDRFEEKLSPLESIGKAVGKVIEGIGDIFQRAAEVIGDALSHIGDLISGAITPETFSASLDTIQTGLLAGILLIIRRFFKGGLNVNVGEGLFDSVKDSLEAVTGTLQNMQTNLKADILLKIAAALGILTASLVVLALIDARALAKALAAMAAGFGILAGGMLLLSNTMSMWGAGKMAILAAALIGLSTALLIMAAAVKIFTTMDFGEMMRGLFGIATMLYIIQKSMGPLTKNVSGMVRVAVALTILGVALNILGIALKLFASMSLEEMGKGMIGMAGSLLIFAGAMRLMPKGATMITTATGLAILAAALNGIAIAMKIFATMSWAEMAKGMVGVAGALIILAGAMRIMPKGMILQAAALTIIAGSLVVLGVALKSMGGMSWEAIGKGLVVLAGALLILGVGLQLMGVTGLIGAVALMAVAGALVILTPVLLTLGTMDWETIIKSLTMLAGVFVILGLAGYILAPLTPVILGLAAAMLLIGVGLAAAGAGALAFATAFGVIVATGAAGIEMLGKLLSTAIAAIPKAMAAFGRGIASFVVAIAQGGPRFVSAMSRIISNMLDAVIKNVPKMGKAFMTMLNTGLRIISQMSPKIFNAGLKLILGFLRAVDSKIGKITETAISIIVKFINALSRKQASLIQAGVRLIINFINGLSRAIDRNADDMGRAGGRLAVSIVTGMARGIAGGLDVVKRAAVNLAKNALSAATSFLKSKSPSKRARDELGKPIPQGMAIGINDEARLVEKAGEGLAATAMRTLQGSLSGMSDALGMSADMRPTVTPVLDLSEMTREANRMNSLLTAASITPTVSYANAADISAETQAVALAAVEAAKQVPSEVKFEQNNYSPKALSSIDIYRNTRNQFSLAKEALTP